MSYSIRGKREKKRGKIKDTFCLGASVDLHIQSLIVYITVLNAFLPVF